MATTFNTRIQLKYDTYTNWDTNNPTLLKGEMAIVEVPDSTGVAQNEPTYLLKVGDGVSDFKTLKWVSGTAADVYSWAKAAQKPTYQASEIQGLEDFIGEKVEDTDTQYQIIANGDMGFKLQSKPKTGGEWADVNEITLTPPTYNLIEGETNGTVKFGITGSETEVKVHGLGSAAYTETSAYDAAGTGASEAGKVKTELVGGAEDTSDKDTIKGAKKYAEEKASAAQSAAEGHADSLIAGLNAEGQTAGTGEVISKVTQANGIITVEKKTLAKEDIPTIEQTQVNGLTGALAGKQDTLVFNTPYDAGSNKAATMADVQNSIEGLSGAMHYIGESTTNPADGTVNIEAKPEYSPAAGDVVTYQKKEFVYDGAAWRELGDESSFAVKGSIKDADIASDANIAQSKIAGLESALASKATPGDITSAIEALDVAITNVATGNKITAIEQVDGKISVTTGAITAEDIPEIGQDKVTGLTETLAGKAGTDVTDGLSSRLDTAEGEIDTLQASVGEIDTKISTAIGALDKDDSAVENQFVTSVSEENGVITVSRAQPEISNVNGLQGALDAKANDSDISTVGKTGNISDLIPNATIILNCGSSTEVMDK